MNWIGQIVKAVLEWLTTLARQDTTSIDAKPDPALRDQLLARLPDDGVRHDAGSVRSSGRTNAPGGPG